MLATTEHVSNYEDSIYKSTDYNLYTTENSEVQTSPQHSHIRSPQMYTIKDQNHVDNIIRKKFPKLVMSQQGRARNYELSAMTDSGNFD